MIARPHLTCHRTAVAGRRHEQRMFPAPPHPAASPESLLQQYYWHAMLRNLLLLVGSQLGSVGQCHITFVDWAHSAKLTLPFSSAFRLPSLPW